MLPFETSITFSKDSQPDAELRNFWPPEDGFVWSGGRWAEIIFAFTAAPDSRELSELVLDLDVFKFPPDLEAQNLFVYLNGLRIGSRLVNKRVTTFLEFEPSLLREVDNVLTLDTPDSAKPSQFKGNDDRLLGVQLYSLQVRKVGRT